MIEIKDISKSFTDSFGYKIELFENVSFEIIKNRITTIVAPSGTGKTSLLRIIAGLEIPSAGEIVNKGESVIFIPSESSSFPWLTTKENIQLALINKDKNLFDEIIKLIGLEGYEDHYANNLSLGYRFRISLARSIIRKPSLIVIDEPFNKMDELTKLELYILLRKIIENIPLTFLFTTTNISEAVFLSDHIFLMQKNPGRIVDNIDIQSSLIRDENTFSLKEFKEHRLYIEEKYKSIDSQKLVNISI